MTIENNVLSNRNFAFPFSAPTVADPDAVISQSLAAAGSKVDTDFTITRLPGMGKMRFYIATPGADVVVQAWYVPAQHADKVDLTETTYADIGSSLYIFNENITVDDSEGDEGFTTYGVAKLLKITYTLVSGKTLLIGYNDEYSYYVGDLVNFNTDDVMEGYVIDKSAVLGRTAIAGTLDTDYGLDETSRCMYFPLSGGIISTGTSETNGIDWIGPNGGTFSLRDPGANSQALLVSRYGDHIEVALKTGAGGAIESTPAEIVAAVEAVDARWDLTADGVSAVAAAINQALVGGTTGAQIEWEVSSYG